MDCINGVYMVPSGSSDCKREESRVIVRLDVRDTNPLEVAIPFTGSMGAVAQMSIVCKPTHEALQRRIETGLSPLYEGRRFVVRNEVGW